MMNKLIYEVGITIIKNSTMSFAQIRLNIRYTGFISFTEFTSFRIIGKQTSLNKEKDIVFLIDDLA